MKSNHPLGPGLYLIPTPLGNLGDITLRAMEYLKSVDILACEDTRTTRRLLGHLGIQSPFLVAYHDHNGEKMRPKIVAWIKEGKRVGLVSDAGTPLISDPGFKLVRAVQEEKLFMTSLPGPSSVVTALTLSGMPTDQFLFAGFVQSAKALESFSMLSLSLIFFSTPSKLLKDLQHLQHIYRNRDVAVVREISKMFEEVQYGSFDPIVEHYTNHPPKGEIVVVLSPPHVSEVIAWETIDAEIERLRPLMKAKELAEHLSFVFHLSKRELYQRILQKKKGE